MLTKFIIQLKCQTNKDDDIRNINESNSNALYLVHLHKSPSGKAFKFECISADITKFCMENGLYVQNLWINPHVPVTDECYNDDFCLRCYFIIDHRAKNCPKPQSYKVCSEC